MIKKLLLPLMLLLAGAAEAQFNNSWIDYSKTYYKFKVASDTLYRIPQPLLNGFGLATVNADNFQLWRNGQQVRIYTSVSGGPLDPAGYIEFWGEMNDGKPDTKLYRDADFQLSDRYSLETDTAAYFLTVNTTGGNLRFINATNPAPGAGTPDPYFMRTINMNYRVRLNRGFATVIGEYIHSASYDAGEGWTGSETGQCCDFVQEIFGLNVYTAGPANSLSLRVNTVGNAPNDRTVRVNIFNNTVHTVGMPAFEYRRINLTGLPLTLLQNPDGVPIYVGFTSTASLTDRIAVSNMGITYPAKFIFNNQKNFEFDLAASATGNNIVIDNFNYGALAPVLYDYTTGARYTGEILSTPGKVKFVLPASASARKFRLVNQEPTNYDLVKELVPRLFLNFATISLQGNYVIISNPLLYNDGSGNNYVEQYRAYRASVAGGSYTSKVYDINELTDQFAFGIKKHPEAIRNFMAYASQQFSVKPAYVFIIGRGMNYMEQRANESNPLAEKLNLVTTFGYPASDQLLVSAPALAMPLVPIGRLGAVSGTEVNYYLQKMIQYEQQQKFSSPTIADKGWLKNMIHVAGGKDSSENQTFRQYMNGYKVIAEDTLYGAHVETFSKTSTGAVQQANSFRIEQLFNEGLSFIGYFGHSSANSFEFNLSNPNIYNNAGKYPFFNVSGCSAGNFFIFDPARLTGNVTLSEKYVLANQRGSIGFLADTYFGIPPYLNFYNLSFYNQFVRKMYGNTVGQQIKRVTEDLGGNSPFVDFYTRVHLEEIVYHGDPALTINAPSKPDYVIEDQLVKISPNIITVADNSFNIKIKMQNLGKAIKDSIYVTVKRKLPNDTIRVLFNQLIRGIRYMDSLDLNVLISPTSDKGLNQLIITLDATNRVDELYETNNTLTKDFYIFEDELRPSYPYNYSIINQPNIVYVANTANPLSGQRQYVMEIDTTETFNSAFKKSYNVNGPGGIVQFAPANITYTDSTVYYWRVAMVPIGTAAYIWNAFSFIYLPASTPGFNQSHYYQHQKSTYKDISLLSDRKFHFNELAKTINIKTGLYPFWGYDRINVNLDFDQLELYGCQYNSLQFYVFDPATLKPWDNRNVSATNAMYGSYRVCPNSAIYPDTTRRFFEYPYNNAAYRQSAMNFIDLIPNGMYVGITNLGNSNNNTSFISQWKADTLTLGSGNSLYHKLKSIGFNQIDSFTRNVPFMYFFQKGNPVFPVRQVIGDKDSSYIDEGMVLNSIANNGYIESPVFGPAKAWKALHWRGSSTDPLPQGDTVKI
ncbi:MAG TPA: C25 family cysteine peptidase, partial [Ferruginibacter sp.]|nr:C25 family cysteine peptidase [Ferruginibacter sp.]